MSAAIPVSREELLRWHAERARAEDMRRRGAPAKPSPLELVSDAAGDRLAPVVHCDRDLSGWTPICSTFIR